MNTDQEIASHLNYVRVVCLSMLCHSLFQRETDGDVRRIPDVAYRTYNKNFEDPSVNEGFKEVKIIDFIPDLRDDEKFKRAFLQWTPEGI